MNVCRSGDYDEKLRFKRSRQKLLTFDRLRTVNFSVLSCCFQGRDLDLLVLLTLEASEQWHLIDLVSEVGVHCVVYEGVDHEVDTEQGLAHRV